MFTSYLPYHAFISNFFPAMVTLEFLEDVMMFEEIDCPGDTISYNCSIQSNTETLHLSWTVLFPNMDPIEITHYSDSSFDDEEYQLSDVIINTTLVDVREGYIESAITLLVTNSSMNGSILECSISDLDSDEIVITIISSGQCSSD